MHLLQLFGIFVIHLGYERIQAAFNECQTRNTCSECIASSPACSWCEDIYYNATRTSFYKKCDLVGNHKEQKCSSINNPPSNSDITKSADLVGETRVSPQEILVKLRPGQETTVDIKVKTPKNFPIDLYYLMDLSKSMEDDLEQIKTLGDKLSSEMKNITSNFRLGFGGYVDKPLGPYTKTNPDEIRSFLAPGNIQETFGYKNYLSLDEDTTLFKKTLDNVKISYNVDEPEGSLEALMQVVVCEQIGWRNKQRARRIVILTTDATFHYSGDGLLGGVVLPNDGQCHLVNNNYTAWDRFDYPSLSQIRSVMIENEIVPIFATTGNTDLYKKVADFFGEGSGAVADELNKDSTNVVPLIAEAYQKIAKIVNIRTGVGLPDGINVNYVANCGDGSIFEPVKEAFCNNVAIGEQVSFKAEFLAEDCKLKDEKDLKFMIATNFYDISVKLELICDCECQGAIINSIHCTSRGNLTCGMCFCDPMLYGGRFCHCTADEAKNQSLCRKTGDNGAVCNGRGQCDCGECHCNQPTPNKLGEIEYIYGDTCQCSNATCGRSNGGKICGGPDRGICDCGVCKCNSDWQGDTCADECLKGTSNCEDNTGLICNGRGTCKCNKCDCVDGYIGDLCQECVTNCPDPCQDFRECVKCRVFETSDLTADECVDECAKWNITSHIVVKKVPEERRCIARDEDDCSFVFTFKKDNVTEQIQLIVQEDRICPAEPDILAIILGVIAGIVGIGLALLLIWKLLATIQDRREFAKFEKDRQNPKWDSGENPIYQKATSTFQNPMYGNQPEPEPQM